MSVSNQSLDYVRSTYPLSSWGTSVAIVAKKIRYIMNELSADSLLTVQAIQA